MNASTQENVSPNVAGMPFVATPTPSDRNAVLGRLRPEPKDGAKVRAGCCYTSCTRCFRDDIPIEKLLQL